jgi:hypothetical protein
VPSVQRLTLLLGTVVGVLALGGTASASPYAQFGVQDDAWLLHGPGTVESRVAELDSVGVDIVRFTLDWSEIERRRGQRNWGGADAVLEGLRAREIDAVVTLYGTPRWANGGRAKNWAPTSGASFASFAAAAANRYWWVTKWLVWNEPNQRRWLRPTTPLTYVTKLLNPAYAALHKTLWSVQVGAGVTAPRGSAGGVSPVDWIRGMRAAGARLDAYAHHPYPLSRFETPWAGGCRYCATITMATLGRLQFEVKRAWGAKRIWLTEYGYQTNPPDRVLGVSLAQQAAFLSEGARRVHDAPRVDMLIHYLYKDEPNVARWQSGLMSVRGAAKPSRRAFPLPLAQVSRTGVRTVLWGQVRPREGRQRYILQQFRDGRWHAVGPARLTTARGYLLRTVSADRGARFRLWYPRDEITSPILVIR